ncbi:MAG: ExbD/TolR family protein [Desulfobacterales bacterium]
MRIDRPAIRRARIEMLPLIDIVFLLLVFFIYAMLSMAVHRGLPVVLPTSSTAKVDKKLLLSVSIKSDGTIYVDEAKVQIENLTKVLAERAKEKTEPGVLLFADYTIKYQRLFRVLDRIRAAGLSRISLQAEMDK